MTEPTNTVYPDFNSAVRAAVKENEQLRRVLRDSREHARLVSAYSPSITEREEATSLMRSLDRLLNS